MRQNWIREEDLYETKYSIRDMVKSPNFLGKHYFWHIVIPQIMFLFDSPAVSIELYGEESKFNVLPEEYDWLERWLIKWSGDRLKEKPVYNQAPYPLGEIGRLREKYKKALSLLQKTQNDEKRFELYQNVIRNQNSPFYSPIKERQLLEISGIILVPIKSGNNIKGEAKIYLGEKREIKEKELHKIVDLFKYIYSEYSKQEGEKGSWIQEKIENIKAYCYREEKKKFLDLVDDICKSWGKKLSIEQLSMFSETFKRHFSIVDPVIQEVLSRINDILGMGKESKIVFTFGDKYEKQEGVHYLLTCEQIEEILKRGLAFDSFKEIWIELFGSERGLATHLLKKGVPVYAPKACDDIRLLYEQTHINLECKLLDLGSSEKGWPKDISIFEVPLLFLGNNKAGYDIKTAFLVFSRGQIEPNLRQEIFKLAHQTVIALILIALEGEQKKIIATERAEDWMHLSAGTSHSFGNYCATIKDYISGVLEEEKIDQKTKEKLEFARLINDYGFYYSQFLRDFARLIKGKINKFSVFRRPLKRFICKTFYEAKMCHIATKEKNEFIKNFRISFGSKEYIYYNKREFQEDDFYIWCVEPLLRFIFHEMSRNAFEYSDRREKPLLEVRIEQISKNTNARSQEEVDVEDRVILKFINKLYGDIFPSEAERKSWSLPGVGKGDGLGLFVINKFLEHCNGYFSCTEEVKKDMKVCFEINIPKDMSKVRRIR